MKPERSDLHELLDSYSRSRRWGRLERTHGAGLFSTVLVGAGLLVAVIALGIGLGGTPASGPEPNASPTVAATPDPVRLDRLIAGPACAAAGHGPTIAAALLSGSDVTSACRLRSSRDGGRTWVEELPTESVISLAVHQDKENFLAGTASGRIYRREGAGPWRVVRDGSLGFQPQVTVVMFVGDVAYAGGRGIFRSADQGATWSDLTAGLGGLGVPESDRGRFTVTGLGRSATQLYAAINANRPETGLWARDDRTGNWSQLTLPRPGFVSALVANDQRLVIAFDPNNGPSDPLTFVSDDAGRTWSALNGGRGLSAIVRAGSEIIAGGQGLWKLEKDRWVPIGSGSSSIVRSMARSDESSAFAAATDGVWRIQVP